MKKTGARIRKKQGGKGREGKGREGKPFASLFRNSSTLETVLL